MRTHDIFSFTLFSRHYCVCSSPIYRCKILQKTHTHARTQISQSRNEFVFFFVSRSLKSNVSINLTVKFLFIWMFSFVCRFYLFATEFSLFWTLSIYWNYTVSGCLKSCRENYHHSRFFSFYFFLNDGNRSFCMYEFSLSLSIF